MFHSANIQWGKRTVRNFILMKSAFKQLFDETIQLVSISSPKEQVHALPHASSSFFCFFVTSKLMIGQLINEKLCKLIDDVERYRLSSSGYFRT